MEVGLAVGAVVGLSVGNKLGIGVGELLQQNFILRVFL